MDGNPSNDNGDGLNITTERVSDTQTKVTVKLGSDVVLVDKLDVSKHKSRAEFLSKLCEVRNGIGRSEVEQRLLELAAGQEDPHEKRESPGPSREELLDGMTPLARQQARAMLEDPQLVKRIVDDIGEAGVAGEKEVSLV